MAIDYRTLRRSPAAYAESLNQKELLDVLKTLDIHYYVKDKPKVNNNVYEILKDAFAERYPKHAYLKQVSAKSKGEVELPYPMGSLRKVKPNSQALDKFIAASDGEYCLSDKLDGISIEVIYRDGVPVEAYTRGENGITGKDVSRHIKSFKIPKRISFKGEFPVRGEAIISESIFKKKLSLESGGDYKTARNAVGGMINGNESSNLFKNVHIVMFRILGGQLANKRQSWQLKKMESLGFEVPKYKRVKSIDSEMLSDYYALRSKKSKYEIDGIVIEYNKVNKLVSGYPSYAKAFKENLETDMVNVKLKDVIWQDSRTGSLTPVGIIEPTIIGGVTVSRVSLHNYYTVLNGFSYKDRKLGLPIRPLGKGAVVKMVRSGKVIPHVVTVLKAARVQAKPSVPFKVSGVEAIATEKNDASSIRAITHFFSTLKVEGLKTGTVTKLFDAGYDSVIDICLMSKKDWHPDIVGAANARKLPLEIKKKVYNADVVSLAHASNIFKGVGTTRFESVFDAYPNIVKEAEIKSPDYIWKKIMKLPNFGMVISKTLAENMVEFSDFLKDLGIKIRPPKKVEVTSATMKDVVVAYTGVRDEKLKQWIIANGGKVASSFTQAVTILIRKDDNFVSGTVEKAEDRGVKIMSRDAFIKKFKVKL